MKVEPMKAKPEAPQSEAITVGATKEQTPAEEVKPATPEEVTPETPAAPGAVIYGQNFQAVYAQAAAEAQAQRDAGYAAQVARMHGLATGLCRGGH
jgi:hypothetical protein